MTKSINTTSGSIAATQTLLQAAGELILPDGFNLSDWIKNSTRRTFWNLSWKVEKTPVKDPDQVPDGSIVCYDLLRRPQATHYAILLDGMTVEFAPNQLSASNGAINVRYFNPRKGWYLPLDSYFSRGDSPLDFLEFRVLELRKLSRLGSGTYPTDRAYDFMTFNCQHFVSLLLGEVFSPEVYKLTGK